ncbi:hypothetical protein PSPO01_07483 [Paraphaeosphaeria sporulosa]
MWVSKRSCDPPRTQISASSSHSFPSLHFASRGSTPSSAERVVVPTAARLSVAGPPLRRLARRAHLPGREPRAASAAAAVLQHGPRTHQRGDAGMVSPSAPGIRSPGMRYRRG